MLERILVIGGTGLVGNALVRAWAWRGAVPEATSHRRPGPHFLPLDMREAAAVDKVMRELRPTLVAVPAANPHVDYCELNPEETRAVNVRGTRNVLSAARAWGARLIFFSSDYVFDGEKGSYGEEDPPSPINEYGRQKAEVEAAVLAADSRNLVIRTSGVYGWQREPKNFVLQVRARLLSGQGMKVACDLKYNPTYAENLAELTAELVAAGRAGIFHLVGADRIGRCDFAREAARAFGLDESLIEPVPNRELNSGAPRPKESSLATDKARGAVAVPLWGIRRSLEHMVSFEAQWRRHAAEFLA